MGKEASKNEAVEDETGEMPKEETEDKVEEKVDGVKMEQDIGEKGSKMCPRTKSSAAKKEKSEIKEAEEKKEKNLETPMEKKSKQPKTSTRRSVPKSPIAFAIQRPLRERKTVERLVDIVEKDTKELRIEKGCGTVLKDIPNVAYKLSRKKSDDACKFLHTILFGRRGKAAEIKKNISKFSGFVWHDDEVKQMTKLKEKLDKCIKEKLVGLFIYCSRNPYGLYCLVSELLYFELCYLGSFHDLSC